MRLADVIVVATRLDSALCRIDVRRVPPVRPPDARFRFWSELSAMRNAPKSSAPAPGVGAGAERARRPLRVTASATDLRSEATLGGSRSGREGGGEASDGEDDEGAILGGTDDAGTTCDMFCLKGGEGWGEREAQGRGRTL